MSATRTLLPDGRRWHFHHGPIDLVLEAWGEPDDHAQACEQAWRRFETVLVELVGELPLLRCPIPAPLAHEDDTPCPLSGDVARRMWRACAPHAAVFITPMAAVAGAVADEILAAMLRGRPLRKAYVNNGGDIALHLAEDEHFETGIVGNLAKPKITAKASIESADGIGGIATSGWRGRSFSLGIADSVTVLAPSAAAADAAATIIANAVNVDHPAIARQRASDLDPDSDLGDHRVTTAVGPLDDASVASALAQGCAAAEALVARGAISAAFLELAGVPHTVPELRHPSLPRPAPDKMAWSLRA